MISGMMKKKDQASDNEFWDNEEKKDPADFWDESDEEPKKLDDILDNQEETREPVKETKEKKR